jgi:hypothetical protein
MIGSTFTRVGVRSVLLAIGYALTALLSGATVK